MKLKSTYIYLILFAFSLITIILLSSESGDDNMLSGEMPKDEIHNNISRTDPISPSNQNVTEEFRQMMTKLGEYVSKNPKDTIKMMEYADLLSASHQEEEAENYYKKILEIDIRRPDVLTKIASLKYNTGNYAEAKEYIAQIIALDSDNLQAIFNLGIIEEKIGDIEEAKKQWEKLLTNHPNSKMSDMAKEALERLASQ